MDEATSRRLLATRVEEASPRRRDARNEAVHLLERVVLDREAADLRRADLATQRLPDACRGRPPRVHTGVKSAGCEKRMAHLPFFHSWNESMSPCVVSALKSGTTLPRRRLLSDDCSG